MTKCRMGIHIPVPSLWARTLTRSLGQCLHQKRCLRWGCLTVCTCEIAKKSFRKTGLLMQSLQRIRLTQCVTILVYTQASHFLYGRRKGGFTRMIREGGFSGTAGTSWVEEFLKRTKGRLSVGKHLLGTLRR